MLCPENKRKRGRGKESEWEWTARHYMNGMPVCPCLPVHIEDAQDEKVSERESSRWRHNGTQVWVSQAGSTGWRCSCRRYQIGKCERKNTQRRVFLSSLPSAVLCEWARYSTTMMSTHTHAVDLREEEKERALGVKEVKGGQRRRSTYYTHTNTLSAYDVTIGWAIGLERRQFEVAADAADNAGAHNSGGGGGIEWPSNRCSTLSLAALIILYCWCC